MTMFLHEDDDKPVNWAGYRYKMAYDIVTEESAQEGDTAKNGWECEQSEMYETLAELLRDVSDHTWLEWSCSHPNMSHDWLNSEAEQDFRSGEHTSYQLWIERVDGLALNAAEFDYIQANLPVLYPAKELQS